MSLRFHEIAETNHRILNPFTDEKLMLVGEICRLQPGMRQLDLACGKAEMLSRWSRAYGIEGVGVDLSPVFIEAARRRAAELDVSQRLNFIQGDAGQFRAEAHAFDVVSCIGATWIGGGLIGTLELMRPALKEGGLLLVGEPYWIEPPTAEIYEASGIRPDDFASLAGTLDRFEQVNVELVEMVLANQDSWDRYEGQKWFVLDRWLRDNTADPDYAVFLDLHQKSRRAYLTYQRRCLGWGVFVLRPR